MPKIEKIAAEFSRLSDEQLAELAAGNYELTDAVMSAFPEMAQDAGFELFDRAWARRYWRAVVRQVAPDDLLDSAKQWGVEATVVGMANLLVTELGLPTVAVPAAVALSVIVIRAARQAAQDDKPGSDDVG